MVLQLHKFVIFVRDGLNEKIEVAILLVDVRLRLPGYEGI